MAAHRPLHSLRQLLLLKGAEYSRSATQGPRSCVDAPVPPCVPCERVVSPPCRAKPSHTRPALHVTCCAPQPHAPPPCVPQEQQLTCLHARPTSGKPKKPMECNPVVGATEPLRCGAELDRVARRLTAAENTRREHYEREASIPPLPDAATSAPTYRLAPERECVRATDGCDYTLAASARPQKECPRCDPNRCPPAPRLAELTPSDACEPDRGVELDPCAHRPRILLHVDRVPAKDPSSRSVRTSSTAPVDRTPLKRPSPRERLTTRIMETLNLKRENKISCPKSKCTLRDNETSSRCLDLPKPVAAPPRCREPSIVEQLRQRPGRIPSRRCGDSQRDSRHMHTSSSFLVCDKPCAASKKAPTTTTTEGSKNDTKKDLEAVMRDRSQLKEAARGRVVRPMGAAGRPGGPEGGQLELHVPPASESVRVRVSLDFIPRHVAKCPSMVAVAPVRNCKNTNYAALRSLNSRSDNSWLSIRGIQKKWAGYRKNDESSIDATIDTSHTSRPAPVPGASKPNEDRKPNCGCKCPPCKLSRYSSSPEFRSILW